MGFRRNDVISPIYTVSRPTDLLLRAIGPASDIASIDAWRAVGGIAEALWRDRASVRREACYLHSNGESSTSAHASP